jgi:hypothetical protein
MLSATPTPSTHDSSGKLSDSQLSPNDYSVKQALVLVNVCWI